MQKQEHWYAIYTKARWEKKVAGLLQEQGFNAYCPLNKVERRWSDRTKIVDEPLFKSYVFVKIEADKIARVRKLNGVVNFVYWNGKPAVIRQKEIDNIRRFLNEYEDVVAEPVKFSSNQRVKMMSGIWMHEEGIVLRAGANKVQIYLEALGYVLTASLRKNEIKLI